MGKIKREEMINDRKIILKLVEIKEQFVLMEIFKRNHICLFDYLFISSQMSAKPYFIGSTGILLLW